MTSRIFRPHGLQISEAERHAKESLRYRRAFCVRNRECDTTYEIAIALSAGGPGPQRRFHLGNLTSDFVFDFAYFLRSHACGNAPNVGPEFSQQI